MKFTVPITCSSCGCIFPTIVYGESDFPPVLCPQCGLFIYVFDHLSISVLADRLLLQSQQKISEGDFTLSILYSSIGVECALTQVFLKWKAIDHLISSGLLPTEIEQSAHEQEYKKKTSPGGFAKAANFVSDFLVGGTYDKFVMDFIGGKREAALIKAGFPPHISEAKSDHIHASLFVKRNRIMHWGEVSYGTDDASSALTAASVAISIIKAMDHQKNMEREKAWRSSMNNQP